MRISREVFEKIISGLRDQAQAFAEEAQPVFQKMGWTWGCEKEPPTVDEICGSVHALINQTARSFSDGEGDSPGYGTSSGRIEVMVREWPWGVDGQIALVPVHYESKEYWANQPTSLTYGVLPERGAFLARCRALRPIQDDRSGERYWNGPYPMELVGKDAEVVREAVNQGIDSHLEAVEFTLFEPLPRNRFSKMGVRINTPESMYTLLRRIMERSDAMSRNGTLDPATLVGDILAGFGFEWV